MVATSPNTPKNILPYLLLIALAAALSAVVTYKVNKYMEQREAQ